MILIADSGSTKTDWAMLLPQKQPRLMQTPGINPYQQNQSEIRESLSDMHALESEEKITNVYFYGTGCALTSNQTLVAEALQSIFKNAQIEVYHDLLGTVRSMCRHESGVAAILGTGSNACLYNGKDITSPARSLGYILGDEGSGAYLGKKLITDFLQEDMPEDLRKLFFAKYQIDRAQVLEAVYQKPYPNRYLASFSPFLKEHLTHPYSKDTLNQAFNIFFDKYIFTLPEFQDDIPLFFTGSIAWHYQEILHEVAYKKRLTIKAIVQKPMNGLIQYHQNS